MYHLHYYPELYRKQHIPIHYILAIGYDDEEQAVYAMTAATEECRRYLTQILKSRWTSRFLE